MCIRDSLGVVGTVKNIEPLPELVLYLVSGVAKPVKEFAGGLKAVSSQPGVQLPVGEIHGLAQAVLQHVWNPPLALPAAVEHLEIRGVPGAAPGPLLLFHQHHPGPGMPARPGRRHQAAAAAPKHQHITVQLLQGMRLYR